MTEEKKAKKVEQVYAKIDKMTHTDPKKAVKILTLFFGLLMVVVMTITNFAISESFSFIKWVSNSCILVAIMVFGILMGESLGQDRQMGVRGGLYQTSLLNYSNFIKSIENEMQYFHQWFYQQIPTELDKKKVRYLMKYGVESKKAESIIKYCQLKDLNSLVHSEFTEIKDDKGEIIIIRQIEEYQEDIVKYVLSGEIKLDISDANSYMSATGRSSNKSAFERDKAFDKEISFNKKANRIKKIVFSLGVSLIFGLFAVEAATGGDQASMWTNLVTRITAMFTAFCSGWSSAITTVRLMSEKVDNKVNILKLFHYSIENKSFVPLSEDELVKKQYKEWKEKKEKEEEEAKKNVVTPDEILEEEENKKKIAKKEPKALENKSNQIGKPSVIVL